MFHSQRLSDTPLKCWLILQQDGEVCCAHCNCMAGLGEVCTHVAAVLFYIEALSRIEGQRACTEGQCAWVMPSSMKSAQYLLIMKLDFTSFQGQKCKFDDTIDGCDDVPHEIEKPKEGTRSTSDELASLFQALSVIEPKVGVLSVVSEYSDVYVPKITLPSFPQPITSLHKSEYVELEYHDLLDVCQSTFDALTITEEMAEQVELEIRQQAKSNLWYKFRAGRITASNMKAVCRTNSANPSKSLIKRICYPD